MEGIAEKRGPNGLQLKLLAAFTMVIDHVAAGMIPAYSAWYEPMRVIGRLAFPIFAFLLAEGACRTSNALRYLLRLVIFGVLSEIPYDCFFHDAYFNWNYQNIFFTLVAGLGAILCFRAARRKWPDSPLQLLGAAGGLACVAAAQYAGFDYGAAGVALIFGMYQWRTAMKDSRLYPFLLAGLMALMWQGNKIQLWSILAIPPLYFYNGERGGHFSKYVFYAFYPAHIILLLLIRALIPGGGTL